MILQCAKCKHYPISVYSRKKYFITLSVYFVLALLGYYLLTAITKEKDIDRIVIIGIFAGILIMVLGSIFGIYYAVKAIVTKETIYACGYCKNQLREGEVIRHVGNDTEILQEIIKKKK